MSDYIEISAKTVDDAITEALIKLETTSDKIEYEVIDKGSTGVLGFIGKKPAIIRVKKKFNLVDYTNDFLSDVFKAMGIDVKSEITYDEESRNMDILFTGDEMGILIGKRGQTLDSLQYIISLVVNKESDAYVRVKVDTENYRERRKETLETLAKNIAYKVKRTRRSVSLEPMNPYERRIIHSALQNDKYVETHSEGEEPYRKVVVTLKRYNKERRDYKKGNSN
ncbi:MAG: protein jag [Clostridiales bacterium]|nr:protein jag [Clostridiales bacterium]MDY3745723.1 RNA-binding cell elongation regulator Jag/EloR [Lachnospiraceae bacterium]